MSIKTRTDRLRAGYVRGRIDVGSLLGVCRQRSESIKARTDRLWAGYVRGRVNVGSLLGVCRQRSEKFKAHQNSPCAEYKGGRSLQIRRLCPCVWTADIQVRRRGFHLRSGALRSERG